MRDLPPSGPGPRNELSGTAQHVVQAGAVHGGVHLHQPPGTPVTPVPWQVPLGTPHFTGRAAQLAALDAVAFPGTTRSDSRVAAITGTAGVGKTALAVHWAQRVRSRLPDGALYVNLRGYDPGPPTSPQQALDGLLRALGTHPTAIPADLDAQTGLYRSLLNDRRMAVILDNAASAAQVRPLLPGSPECPVIVTSRSRLPGLAVREGVRRVPLDLLTPEEADTLLRQILGPQRVDAEPRAAAELTQRCGHLPLALHIAAERAATRRHATLAELAEELADEQDRLGALTVDDDETTAVRAVFSWSYRALPPGTARAFRLLGLHAGPDLCTAAAAALLGSTLAHARRQLDILTGVHLLEETGRDRFRFHDLLRFYAVERALADEPETERKRAVQRVLGWYLRTVLAAGETMLPMLPFWEWLDPGPMEEGIPLPLSFTDRREAVKWCEGELPNLVAATHQAAEHGEYAIAWRIPACLIMFFDMHKPWADWIATHELGIRSARHIGDALGATAMLIALGDCYRALRRFDDAVRCLQEALTEQATAQDPWITGMALLNLAFVRRDLQQFGEVLALGEQALSLHRSIGDGWCAAWSLLAMSDAYRALGRFDEALASSQEALTLHRETGDPWATAWTQQTLGNDYRALRRFDEAAACCRQALALHREAGDLYGEALGLVALGEVWNDLADPDAARDCWRQAATIFEKLGAPQAAELHSRLQSL